MIDPQTGQMVKIQKDGKSGRTEPGQLLKGNHHKDGEYFEPEVKVEVFPEEEEVGRPVRRT